MKALDLSVGWIDFREAYDCVQHKWIREALRISHAPPQLVELIRRLNQQWATRFEVRLQNGDKQRTALVRYQRGVNQGDALSPLLFCLSIIPVSKALNQFSSENTDLDRIQRVYVNEDH